MTIVPDPVDPHHDSSGRTRVRRRRRSARSETRSSLPPGLNSEWARPLAAFSVVGLLVPIHLRGIPPVVSLVLGALALALALGAVAVWGKFSRPLLRQGYLWCLAAGLLWTVVSAIRSPFPAPAASDLLRILTGAAAFTVGAFVLDTPFLRRSAFAVLALTTAAMAVTDLMGYGVRWQESTGTHFDATSLSRFGSHETTGTLLSLALPILVAFSVAASTDERLRMLAVASTFAVGFAWISVRCRSAWVGGTVAIAWVLALAAWQNRRHGRRREPTSPLMRWLMSPLPLVLLLWVGLIATGGLSGALSDRLRKAMNLVGPSMVSRLELWKAGASMATEQPWWGFGLGAYLVRQGEWSHRGQPSWEVLKRGGDLSNVAHNYTVQWAADTGWVGVGLLALGVASVLALAGRTVFQGEDRDDRTWGYGVQGAVLGAVATSMGSPAFHIGFVWCLLCLMAGIGCGPGLLRSDGPRWRIALLTVVVAMGTWGAAGMARRWATVPRAEPGIWELNVDAPGGIRPGEVVEWKASFRDAKGAVRSTFPGTRWDAPRWVVVSKSGAEETRTPAGEVPLANLEVRGVPVNSSLGHASLRVRIPDQLPGTTAELWVVGRFRDVDSNDYEALSVVTVERPGKPVETRSVRP